MKTRTPVLLLFKNSNKLHGIICFETIRDLHHYLLHHFNPDCYDGYGIDLDCPFEEEQISLGEFIQMETMGRK